MGHSFTNNHKIHAMKSIFVIFGLAFAEIPIENDKKANSVLRSRRAPKECGLFDFGCTDNTDTNLSYDEQQKADAKQFMEDHSLNSIEAWEEMKDKFEENKDVPKEGVEELEKCIGKCKRRDTWLSWQAGDKSVEERKENQEKAYEKTQDQASFEPRIVPCPKCFRYIPKEAAEGIDFDAIIGVVGGLVGG